MMQCSYEDITGRPEEALWRDEAGITRYEAFAPEKVRLPATASSALPILFWDGTLKDSDKGVKE